MDYNGLLIVFFCGFSLPSCYHGNLREYHYVNLPMNWTDAQNYCRVKYTDLATIGSSEDISRLNRPSLDTPLAWIGLEDNPESWKKTMGNDANSWRWSATGETSATGYQMWRSGWPNYVGAHQICVFEGGSGQWRDDNCNNKLHFVCYNATTPSDMKTYTEIANYMTWYEAQTYCRTYHTDLAMIESAMEHAEMSSIRSLEGAWIGLYRVPWKWSDKSNSSLKNWGSGRPNNYGGNQWCVTENSNHQWDDINCNNKQSFLCQGALKVKMTAVRMKIQTVADLSDPATEAQILQQLGAMLTDNRLTGIKLQWRIQRRKKGEEKDEADGHCNS